MNAGCLPGADSAFIFEGGGGIGERPWSLGDFTGEERMMECDIYSLGSRDPFIEYRCITLCVHGLEVFLERTLELYSKAGEGVTSLGCMRI